MTAGVREAEALDVAEGAPPMQAEGLPTPVPASRSNSPATCSAVTAPASIYTSDI